MKTYFIFLCLLISGGLASAAIQATASQDKPPRLYVESYSMKDGGSYLEEDSWNGEPIGELSCTFNGAVNNWSDGSTGTASWSSQFDDNWGSGDEAGYDNADWYWPASSWPNLSATVTETYYNSYSTSCNGSYTISNQPAPVFLEHCDINISGNSPYYSPFYWPTTTMERRTAQAILKLETGGKATSKLRNLFGITGSAAQMNPNDPVPNGGNSGACNYVCSGAYGYLFQRSAGTNIPSQNIAIGSYGNLNANGVLYRILPDNADVDVTPYVAGADYYTFNVSATKYHSYFDLFVQQANPGFSLIFFNPTNDVGHAFWQFRTDAPADALQYISASLNGFLGQKWGFYPSDPNNLFTALGQLQNDTNHIFNIQRTFYIGFPDLLQGLIYTRGLSNSPPEYVLSAFNCVGAARGAGFAADIFGLPWDESPQNFGVTLMEMYPAPGQIIGPFIDTSDIFYSSAQY